MRRAYDVIVVGAGPAGMAAAAVCGQAGAATLLLDEQAALGGQVYRSIENPAPSSREILGADYFRGESLARAVRRSGVDYLPSATVWQVTPDRQVSVSRRGESQLFTARQIIFATGAQERPVPVPGWTLPGVMTAGAAQILLKQSGLLAERAVFAGSGPLLYLVVKQYLAAGYRPRAVLDTTPASNYLRAVRRAWNGWAGLHHLMKGRGWIAQIRRAGIPLIRRVTHLALSGEGSVHAVEFASRGRRERIETEHVFLHQGVVPSINLTMSMRCQHTWLEAQRCWRVVTDHWGSSSIPDVAVAGDGVDIAGALAAEQRGTIAALAALHRLQLLSEQERDRKAAEPCKVLAAEVRFRPFLDALFEPATSLRAPERPETLICRCEEVAVRTMRELASNECAGVNELKSFSRCGMGPCQGRLCGLTACELLASALHRTVRDVGYFRLRPPVKPISVGELAALHIEEGG